MLCSHSCMVVPLTFPFDTNVLVQILFLEEGGGQLSNNCHRAVVEYFEHKYTYDKLGRRTCDRVTVSIN